MYALRRENRPEEEEKRRTALEESSGHQEWHATKGCVLNSTRYGSLTNREKPKRLRWRKNPNLEWKE